MNIQLLTHFFILLEIYQYSNYQDLDVQKIFKEHNFELFKYIIKQYTFLQKNKSFYDRSNPLTQSKPVIYQPPIDQVHKKYTDTLAQNKKLRELKEAQENGIQNYDINQPLYMNSIINQQVSQSKIYKRRQQKQNEEEQNYKIYQPITDQQLKEFQERQDKYAQKKKQDIEKIRCQQLLKEDLERSLKDQEYQLELEEARSKIVQNLEMSKSVYEDKNTNLLIERYKKGREERLRVNAGPKQIETSYKKLRQQQVNENVMKTTQRLTQPIERKQKDKKDKEKCLLNVTVKLTSSGKYAKILITESNRCPEKLAYDFCLTYGLNSEKYLLLVDLLKQQMQENGIDCIQSVLSAEKYSQKLNYVYNQIAQQKDKQPEEILNPISRASTGTKIEELKQSLNKYDLNNLYGSDVSQNSIYDTQTANINLQLSVRQPQEFINDPNRPNPYVNLPIQNSLLDNIKTLVNEQILQDNA